MSVCADEGGTKRRHASIYHNIVLFFQNPRTQREIVCNAATLGTAAASIRRWAKKESLRRVKRRNEVPSHRRRPVAHRRNSRVGVTIGWVVGEPPLAATVEGMTRERAEHRRI